MDNTPYSTPIGEVGPIMDSLLSTLTHEQSIYLGNYIDQLLKLECKVSKKSLDMRLVQACINFDKDFIISEDNEVITIKLIDMFILNLDAYIHNAFSDIMTLEKTINYTFKFKDRYCQKDSRYRELLLVYILLIISGYEVNLYINEELFIVLTPEDYSANIEFFKYKLPSMVVGLHYVRSLTTQKDWIKNLKPIVGLPEDYQEIRNHITNNQYQLDELKIKFNSQGAPSSLNITGRDFDITNYKKYALSIGSGEVGYKRYKGKTKYITIREQKDIKNPIEKASQ